MKETWYQLPDDKCERMNRTEMNAVKWCLAALNSVAYAKDDLAKRLEMIPNGKRRWGLMLGQLRSLVNDLVGTIPVKQCLTIKNTMNDMELRMVPKMTPIGDRVSMSVKDLAYIVREAKKDVCVGCTYTGDECRKCELYRILESIAPLEDWGSSLMCPYSKEDWWDK